MSSTSQFTSSEGGLSLYDVSIPLLIRNLNTTAGFLRKGEQWCKDNNHDPTTTLIKGKIADDMKELPFQVQTACNMAKGVLFRIGGQENTPMDDNEETFAQLYARIDKTVELLKTAKKEKFAKPDAKVELKLGPTEVSFSAWGYIQNFVLPNFFFHMSTAYNILRKAGVPVGKQDFLNLSE